MKKHFIFFLSFCVIFCSCKHFQRSDFDYPEYENVAKEVKKYQISYLNEFSNLENTENDPKFGFWLKKQDSISEDYFKSQEFSDYLEKQKAYNFQDTVKSNIKRNYDGLYYYVTDYDSNTTINSFNYVDQTSNEIFRLSEHFSLSTSLQFFEPSISGNHIMLVIKEDKKNDEHIFVFDVKKNKLTDTGLKDFRSDAVAWVQWLPDNTFAYTGYPISDNTNNVHARLYDPVTNSSKLIYHQGIKSQQVNPNGVPVPYFYPAQPNKLYVYDASASEYYDCYSINLSELAGTSYPVWDKVFDRNDSIIYYADFDKEHIVFKKVIDGNIALRKAKLIDGSFINSKTLHTSDSNSSINEFALTLDNIYFTQSNGISTELFAINDIGLRRIELDYPIGGISLKSSWGMSDSLSISCEGWQKNTAEITVHGDGGFFKLENFSGQETEELKNVEIEIREIKSHDGVMVPLTLIKPKKGKVNSNVKSIISAYGAYGYNYEAYYNTFFLDFVSRGNIIAIAHIRGGGEKGHKWYEDGILQKKANSWKDLIACSDYVNEKLLNGNGNLGLLVESAGGISAGMAINERPDLFKAFAGLNVTLNPISIANNPNYQEDDNAYDFGTTETEEGYLSLLDLDPVVNLNKSLDYPAVYLMAGDKDGLIPISEPAKYVSILQSIQQDEKEPILLNVNFGSGHEYGDYITDLSKAMFFLENEISN